MIASSTPEPSQPNTPETAIKRLYGDGKPPIFVNLAVNIALFSDATLDMIQWYLGRKPPPRELPTVKPEDSVTWLRLYRQHKIVLIDVFEMLQPDAEPDNSIVELANNLNTAPRLSNDERYAANEAMTDQAKLMLYGMLKGVPFPPSQQVINAIVREQESEISPEDDVRLTPLMETPSMIFAFKVWLPCFILYRMHPPTLFRQARFGDIDALEKLLRLDKTVLGDRLIYHQWFTLMQGKNQQVKQRLAEAIEGNPLGRLNKKGVKSCLAGLIAQLGQALYCRPTQAELRTLFDRIAKAKGEQIDSSLPDTPQALQKAIQRNQNWPAPGQQIKVDKD